MTPKFEVGRDFRTVHLPPKFHHAMLTSSEVIVLTNTQASKQTHTHTHTHTHKQTSPKTSNVVRYATTFGKIIVYTFCRRMQQMNYCSRFTTILFSVLVIDVSSVDAVQFGYGGTCIRCPMQWLNYSTEGGGSLFPGETATRLSIRVC